MTDSNFLGPIFLAAGAFFFLFLIILVILYLLSAFGFYRMAQRKKIKDSWMAFIPIANLYIYGKIIEPLKIMGKEIPSLPFVMLGIGVASPIINALPVIGQIISVLIVIFFLFATYRLYDIYSERPVLYFVLSIILPFLGPIFIFALRNKEPKSTGEAFSYREEELNKTNEHSE